MSPFVLSSSYLFTQKAKCIKNKRGRKYEVIVKKNSDFHKIAKEVVKDSITIKNKNKKKK